VRRPYIRYKADVSSLEYCVSELIKRLGLADYTRSVIGARQSQSKKEIAIVTTMKQIASIYTIYRSIDDLSHRDTALLATVNDSGRLKGKTIVRISSKTSTPKEEMIRALDPAR
jgi:GTPase Era involved in 16S rRNA processing